VEATGFFRTHHDGRRWWLADPEGHRFWSAGACCVHPSIDHEVRYETEWMNLRGAMAGMPDPAGDYAAAYGRNPWHAPTDRELDSRGGQLHPGVRSGSLARTLGDPGVRGPEAHRHQHGRRLVGS
jgi:hypothetical protein